MGTVTVLSYNPAVVENTESFFADFKKSIEGTLPEAEADRYEALMNITQEEVSEDLEAGRCPHVHTNKYTNVLVLDFQSTLYDPFDEKASRAFLETAHPSEVYALILETYLEGSTGGENHMWGVADYKAAMAYRRVMERAGKIDPHSEFRMVDNRPVGHVIGRGCEYLYQTHSRFGRNKLSGSFGDFIVEVGKGPFRNTYAIYYHTY